MDKGSLILVVGHFKDEFFKLDSCLKNEGFWIKQVKSFSQLREKHIPSPALILFDVDKPQKAHVKTLKGLQEKYPSIPIIIFSFSNLAYIEKTLNLTTEFACSYMRKPFLVERLKVVIRRSLQGDLCKKEGQTLESSVHSNFTQNKAIQKKENKAEIIAGYMPLVKYVVDRLPVSSLPQISREDLISSGVIGLLKALEGFDVSRGVKFKTYALPRIRGAIMDELRRLDWVPRSLRQKAAFLEKAYLKLERNLGRSPTDEEMSKETGISEKKLHKLYVRINHLSCVSLHNCTDKSGQSLIEKISSQANQSSLEVLSKREVKKILRETLSKISRRERKIIIMRYYEELTLKEIGDVLGVSESRVSQIHGKIMAKLRTMLAKIKESLPV